jgi:pimeloyl-ACP methyl ester carboxylesterase
MTDIEESDPLHVPSGADRRSADGGGHTQGTAGAARTRDGRTLFYMKLAGPAGNTAPVVVFESGIAASRSYWALVQMRVAAWADAVVYDRSGLGRSAPDPAPRTLARLGADLNDLLDHLGAARFVLVGHSAGGPIVRAAAAVRPERIAGLVLVDASDEACDVLFRPSFRRFEKIVQWASLQLARLGLMEPLYRRHLAMLPADAREDFRKEGFTVAVMHTRGAELKGHVAAMNAWRVEPPDLADIPVTAISGALCDSGMSPRIRAAANAAHARRAARARQGRHVLAHQSGHMIPLTEPDLIAAEIRRFL